MRQAASLSSFDVLHIYLEGLRVKINEATRVVPLPTVPHKTVHVAKRGVLYTEQVN